MSSGDRWAGEGKPARAPAEAPYEAEAVATSAGTTLVTLQAYLQQHHGPEAFGSLVAALRSQHAERLRGIPLPHNRYPTEAVVAAMDAACLIFGPSDFHERYGEWSAHYSIHAFFRLFLRFRSPGWLIAHTKHMWSRFHDTGAWEVESGERWFRGTLRDFAVVNSGHCRIIVGWMKGAGKLTGEEVRADHPRCRATGALACVFTAQW